MEQNNDIKKDLNEDMQAVKEIIKEKELRPREIMILEREDLSMQEKLMDLVLQAFKRLVLVNAVLQNPDLIRLEDSHLGGVKLMIEEIYALLDAAVDLHFKTA